MSGLSKDQQVKIYRQVRSENDVLCNDNSISDGEKYTRLSTLHNELETLYLKKDGFTCPKVRFGRTELQMPILTCGGMRQQETWNGASGLTLETINKSCQKNFEDIIDTSMKLGINHFETARAYGTSELQYGPILKKYERNSYILQTKCAPKEKTSEFRSSLEDSFKALQLTGRGDYIDLFSFHGVNKPEHIEWITRSGGNLEVIREYQKEGKIRFIGFSSHGMTPLIVDAIETGIFDYVNLHYHFIGSYTASGTGKHGGNYDALLAAQRHDMGVFIISPTDKGGALYQPSKALQRACLPYTPITFNNLFLWSSDVPIHTLVIGTARTADFDEHVVSAMHYDKRKAIVEPIKTKLYKMVTDTFSDPDFLTTWYKDLPDAYQNDEGIPVSNLIWLHYIVKSWGMYTFALQRYGPLESAAEKEWDDSLSPEENKKKFSWVPGIAYRPARDDKLRAILSSHPRGEYVLSCIKELHSWLSNGGCIKRNSIPADISIDDWKSAYDLQPDIPFPERG